MAGMLDPNSLSQGGFPTRAGLAKLGQAVSTVAKERVVDPVVKTGTSLGMIMRGQIPMYAADESGRVTFNPEVTDTATDAALGMLGGSGLVSAKQVLRNGLDPSQVQMFFGTGAKTADRKALNVARGMLKQGAPREDIIQQTGWFQGLDGKWRFEIPDTDFVMTPDQQYRLYKNSGRNPVDATIGDVITHPELFKAYPQLANQVAKTDATVAGAGSDKQGVYFSPTYFWPGHPAGSIHDSMLHELQHQVQDLEGFSPGGNQSSFRRDMETRKILSDVFDRMATPLFEARKNATGAEKAALTKKISALSDNANEQQMIMQRMRDLQWEGDARQPVEYKYYTNLAGEVEARNVENRFNNGYQKPPWETEDVPATKQFLGFR